MVDKDRVIAEFIELVKIKSSTRQERLIADVLKNKLVSLGVDVTEDDADGKLGGNSGNVLGYLKGNTEAPVLMLSAHMDSVEPCAGIDPIINDGIISSRGDTVLGADDKAGIVAILEAIRVVRESGLAHGDIQVVFTAAEEGGLSGSKVIDRNLLKADFGYVLDSGGEPGRIVVRAPGQNNLEITVHGRSAHAGIAPEDGINAIVVASKAIVQMPQGRIDEETTSNIGIIKGGIATNIVPDSVLVVSEVRSRNQKKLARETDKIVSIFEKVAKENLAKVTIKVSKVYDPFVITQDMPVADIAGKAAKDLGFQAVFEGTGGGSDANFFNSYGIPSAVLGVGMSKVHTTEEYIKVDDLVNAARYTARLIENVANCEKFTIL